MIGTQFAVTLGAPDAGTPSIGVLASTKASNIQSVVTKLVDLASQGGLPLEHRTVSGGYTLATSAGLAGKLAGDGGLGKSEKFTKAVPDAAKSSFVLYLDAATLIRQYGDSVPADTRKTLAPIDALGVSVSGTTKGSMSFSLRVTTH